jgi:hypothetical protein
MKIWKNFFSLALSCLFAFPNISTPCFAANTTSPKPSTAKATISVLNAKGNYIFNLYHTDGSIQLSNLHTDSTGKASISGLTKGNYYWAEVSAPSNQSINHSKRPFSVTEDNLGKTISSTIGLTDSSQTILINATIPTNQVNFSNGDPVFYFKAVSNQKTYYTFAHISPSTPQDSSGNYLCHTSFSNLPIGTYQVVQETSNRFRSPQAQSLTLSTGKNVSCTFTNLIIDSSKLTDTKNIKDIASIDKLPVSEIVSYPNSYATDKIHPEQIKVIINYDNGTTKTISGTDSHIKITGNTFTPSDINKNYSINVSYSENGKIISSSIPVTIKKWPIKMTASYDNSVVTDHISTNHIYATVTYCDGSTAHVPSDKLYLSKNTFSSQEAETSQKIPISYSEYDKTISTNVSVDVKKWLTKLSVSFPNNPIADSIDKNQLIATATYCDGSTTSVNPSLLTLSRNIFTKDDVGKTIPITASYTENGHSVIGQFSAVVQKWPVKLETSYPDSIVNDSINVNKIHATVTYCNGTQKQLLSNNFHSSPITFTNTDVGKNKDIISTYSENHKTVSGLFSVQVSKWPTSMDIQYPSTNGEKIQSSNLLATIHYCDGSSAKVPNSSITLSQDTFTSTDVGKSKVITASFSENGKTVSKTFSTTIMKWPTSISSSYTCSQANDSLDKSNVKTTITYSDGSLRTINGTDPNLTFSKTSFTASDIGNTSVIATYHENNATVNSQFPVPVSKWPTSITVSSTSNTSTGTLHKENISAIITYCDGTTIKIPGTDSNLNYSKTSFSANEVGSTQPVDISYRQNNKIVSNFLNIQVLKSPAAIQSISFTRKAIQSKILHPEEISAIILYNDGTTQNINGSKLSYSQTNFDTMNTSPDITAYYTDSSQETVSKDFVFQSNTPTRPIVTRSPNGNSVTPGTTVSISAASTDADGDAISYVWDGRPSEKYVYGLGKHLIKVKAVDSTGAESPYAAFVFFVMDSNGTGGMILTSSQSRIEEDGVDGATIDNYTFTVPPVSGHYSNYDYGQVSGYNIRTNTWEVISTKHVHNGVTMSGTLPRDVYSKMIFYYYTDHHCMYNKSNITYSVEYYFDDSSLN